MESRAQLLNLSSLPTTTETSSLPYIINTTIRTTSSLSGSNTANHSSISSNRDIVFKQSWNKTSSDDIVSSSTATPPAVDVIYDLLNRALNNLLFDESFDQTPPTTTSVTTASAEDSFDLSIGSKPSRLPTRPLNSDHINHSETITHLLRHKSTTLSPATPPFSTLNHSKIATTMAPLTPRLGDVPEILILHKSDGFTPDSYDDMTIFPDFSDYNNETTSILPTMIVPNGTDFGSGTDLSFQRVCFVSPEDYDLIPSVLCSSLFVLGIVFCTFGARCSRAFAFFLASLLSGLIAYLTLTKVTDYRSLSADIIPPEVALLLLACLIGIVVGTIISLVNPLAAIVVGTHFGALIGVAILTVIFTVRPWVPELQGPIPPGMGIIFGTVLALAGAIATVNMPKGQLCFSFVICLFSFFGALFLFKIACNQF